MIKKAIRYILSFFLFYSGLIVLLRYFQHRQNKFKALVYHRVNNNLHGSSSALSPKRFKEHMSYLKRHYQIVNLAKAVSYTKDNKRLLSEAVIITFDDGYKDIINNVFPIIKELNIPITIFLASGYIGDNKMLWTDRLYYFLKEQNRIQEFCKFKENLKDMDNAERIRISDGLEPKIKKNLMLNWGEVKELSKDNHIEIGAHSRTHPVLTKTDTNIVLEEIGGSKRDIEQAIGKIVFGFSYPAGKFNQEIKKIVKDACFDYACTVDDRFNTSNSDLYSLSRINIDNCPVFVFATELCGVVSWLRRLFNKRRCVEFAEL